MSFSGKHNILKLSVVDSTNNFVKQHFEELHDRTAVVADIQTAGRGRFSRSWSSLEGNIFLTLVLKPQILFSTVSAHSGLTHYLGVTLCLVLEKLGLQPGLKWPNDILLEEKKVSGILAESVPMPGNKMGIIAGIGINLAMPEAALAAIDQPAISLVQLLPPQKRLSRDQFLSLYLDAFFTDYEAFLQKGFSHIQKQYESFMLYRGRHVKVLSQSKNIYGKVHGVSSFGSLLLEREDGSIFECFAGDMWVVR